MTYGNLKGKKRFVWDWHHQIWFRSDQLYRLKCEDCGRWHGDPIPRSRPKVLPPFERDH